MAFQAAAGGGSKCASRASTSTLSICSGRMNWRAYSRWTLLEMDAGAQEQDKQLSVNVLFPLHATHDGQRLR